MKGLGFPDLENLVLLCNWLDLDISMIFKTPSSKLRVRQRLDGFDGKQFRGNVKEAIELIEGMPEKKAEFLVKVIQQIDEI